MSSWARRTGFRGGSDIEINFQSDGSPGPSKPSNLSSEQTPDPANAPTNAPRSDELVSKTPALRGPPGPFNPAKSRTVESDVASRNSSGQLRIEPLRIFKDQDYDVVSMSQDGEDHIVLSKHAHMKYELRESPGLGNVVQFPIAIDRACACVFSSIWSCFLETVCLRGLKL